MRNALLDAAAREFGAHGYDGASINRILLAAGLSKGAFYYYFDDKADLAAEVLTRESAHWIEVVRTLPLPRTAEDFWNEIERLTNRSLEELTASPESRDLIVRIGSAVPRVPQLLERLGPMFAEAQASLAGFYHRGQELGAVRDDIAVPALMTILQGLKQAVSLAILPSDRAPSDAELAEFLRVHLDCFRRVAAPAPKPRAAKTATKKAGGKSAPKNAAKPRAPRRKR